MSNQGNEMQHVIVDNGSEALVSESEAVQLENAHAIYRCDELGCAREDETVYHVWPDMELEQAFEDRTSPFEDVKP